MSKERKALGAGLEALMGTEYEEKILPSENSVGIFAEIEKIIPNPDQPRKEFDEEALSELADSIKEKGIIQPILVEKEGEKYRIIAGERRFRAAKKAGLDKVPIVTGSFTSQEKLEIALIENIQREALTPIEEARAYNSLMLNGNMSQETLAKAVGKKRSTVANSMRLLKLSPEMQEALSKGDITAGHARAILSVTNPGDQQLLFNKIISDYLSVREAEKLALEYSRGNKTAAKKEVKKTVFKSSAVAEAEQKFMDILGTKVAINGTLNKGKLEISYYSQDDLERLLEIIEK